MGTFLVAESASLPILIVAGLNDQSARWWRIVCQGTAARPRISEGDEVTGFFRARSTGFAAAVIAFPLLAGAAIAQQADQTVLYSEGGLTLRWHLQAGAYAAAEQNLFWDLGSLSAPDFDADTEWMEFYV